MTTTYRKTRKGIAEIETRAYRLSPRLRSALIMVDGRRTDAELRALLQQQTDESLNTLLQQGFIEVVGTTLARPAPPRTAAPSAPATPPAADARATPGGSNPPGGGAASVVPGSPAAPAVAAPPAATSSASPSALPDAPPAAAPPAAAAVPVGAELDILRRDVVRAVNEQVGPLAGSLVARLERTRSAEELRPLLDSASRVVGLMRGDEAAADFRARFMNW